MWRRMVLPALFLAVLTACGSKLTQENFNQITNGMPYAEVVKILGEPKSSQAAGFMGITTTTATWNDGQHQVTVVFLNDKTSSKVFGDAEAEATPAQ